MVPRNLADAWLASIEEYYRLLGMYTKGDILTVTLLLMSFWNYQKKTAGIVEPHQRIKHLPKVITHTNITVLTAYTTTVHMTSIMLFHAVKHATSRKVH